MELQTPNHVEPSSMPSSLFLPFSVTFPTSPHIFSTSPGIWPWKVESPLRIPATACQATPWGAVTLYRARAVEPIQGGYNLRHLLRNPTLTLGPVLSLFLLLHLLSHTPSFSFNVTGWSKPPKYIISREIYTSNLQRPLNHCTL